MKLSDFPAEKLRVGMKVISSIGNDGEITDLNQLDVINFRNSTGPEIEVTWSTGNVSTFPHSMMMGVTVKDTQ